MSYTSHMRNAGIAHVQYIQQIWSQLQRKIGRVTYCNACEIVQEDEGAICFRFH
jgi:hypothetical protein